MAVQPDDDSPPSDFFGSKNAFWAAGWLRDLLQCDSVDAVRTFVDARLGPESPGSVEDMLHLKILLHALYEEACAPTDEGWRRIRLAVSAVRPSASDEVAATLDETEAASEESHEKAAFPEPPPPPMHEVPGHPAGGHESPWAPAARAPTPSGATPPPAPMAPSRAATSAPEDSVDSTAFMSPLALQDLESAVPFAGSREPAPEQARDAETPHEQVGKTGALDLAKIASTRTTASSQKPDGEPPIPVERYAMVVACTEDADDARRAQVHAQVGLESEEDRRKLDQEYGRFLRSSPELKLQFIRDLKRWKDWLEGQKEGG